MTSSDLPAPLHQIQCRDCGGHLVEAVRRIHDPGAPAFRWDQDDAGLDHTVRSGCYAHSRRRPFGVEWTPDRRARRLPAEVPAIPQTTFVVNIGDMGPDLELVPGTRWGCCGYDGRHGPNLRCARCQAHVGYLFDDCWTPREVRLLPELVRLEVVAPQTAHRRTRDQGGTSGLRRAS